MCSFVTNLFHFKHGRQQYVPLTLKQLVLAFKAQQPNLFDKGKTGTAHKWFKRWVRRCRDWCKKDGHVSLRVPTARVTSLEQENRRRRRVVGSLNKLHATMRGLDENGNQVSDFIEVDQVLNMDETSLHAVLVDFGLTCFRALNFPVRDCGCNPALEGS